MPDDAQQGFLQGFPGFMLLAARNDEQKLIEAMKIKPVKFPKGIFIAGANASREDGDVRGRVIRGNLGHNGGAIQGR